MKVICTLCCEEWDASKYVIESTYICPHCQWKIDNNESLIFGKERKRGDKRIHKVRDLFALQTSKR